MIENRTGNVLDVTTGIIVHGCNCQGVMGSGIAREIKNRFPIAFHEYERVYRSRGLKLGEISFVEVSPNKFIINANTQDNYGSGGKRFVSYDAIADAFTEVVRFAETIEKHRETKLDVVFPMIGAGLGGGDWKIISAIIDVVVPDHFNKILYVLPTPESQELIYQA
jgi:O-acetyl-ADP-ribose deacetylase (regulator of RNase III)